MMELVLVHPKAALVGLAVVLPLVALWVTSRRAARARAALGLSAERRRPAILLVGATVAVALLVSLAAANPVLLQREPLHARTDRCPFCGERQEPSGGVEPPNRWCDEHPPGPVAR